MIVQAETGVASEEGSSFKKDLEAWSLDRAKWQRHALWKLATNADLTEADFEGLLDCLKREHGLAEASEAEETLFEAAHLGPQGSAHLRLLAVGEIANVNRLDPKGLTFAPAGLTIVYGENGSGKTGFIRVLRKACRSRIEKPQELEILANVYGAVGGPASARFIVSNAGTEETIDWADGSPLDDRLGSFSVFDTRSAQLYVDEGNKLRYLPSDLDLPFRLNDVIRRVEEKLAPEIDAVEKLLEVCVAPFEPADRDTVARRFVAKLSPDAADADIETACAFSAEEEKELGDLRQALSSGPEKIAELRQTASSAKALGQKAEALSRALGAEKAAEVVDRWKARVAARDAHNLTKAMVAGKDVLPGVGSETWVRLWKAAQAYAAEADPHNPFPSAGPVGGLDEAVCPLCQQPAAAAKERLLRFDNFMSSATASELEGAEAKLEEIIKPLRELATTISDAEAILVASVRAGDAQIASDFEAFIQQADAARQAWIGFEGNGELAVLSESDLFERLTAASEAATARAATVAAAQDEAERAKLVQKLHELEDQRVLSACVKVMKERRGALRERKALKAAHASCRRNEVTRQANKWVDVHLTGEAKKVFLAHLEKFRLQHLSVDLERQSTSLGTGFRNAIQGAKGFKRVSDVLSEGEQRALSLAAFLTEAQLERPGCTLIVDDPVSSLDRQRSRFVAEQLVEEAKTRQVIVFTHDLMFLEELGDASKRLGVEPTVQRVFSTPKMSGLLDPAGSPWKGQNVKQRIQFLRDRLKDLRSLEQTSRTDYEVEAKAFYGRLRDAYERLVEEKLFHNVVTRFRSAIQTRELRYVTVPDDIAKRFHEAFSKASLHSHDNPSAADVTPPDTAEIQSDLDALSKLIADIEGAQQTALAARPEMG